MARVVVFPCLISVWIALPLHAQPASGKHALLIGVSKYPGLEARYQLHGPANDVLLMRDLLEKQFGFPKENVTTLAEHQGEAGWPTRTNIEKQFQRLAATVKAGDQVVVLMAGHGSQQPESSDSKDPEPDGLDEIFLPRDVGAWDGAVGKVANAIADDQIGGWLKAIRAKGASVFILFDACHSGTMTRGAGERERQIDSKAALNVPVAAMNKAKAEALKRQRAASPGRPDEPTRVDHAAPGIVAVYACQSSEVTVEQDLPANSNDAKPYGLLTYTIAEVLKQAKRPPTYQELIQKVHTHYANLGRTSPTPQIEGAKGDRDREVLGTATWPGRSSILLKQEGKSYTINAGALAGLTEGSILAVFPPADEKAEKPLGHVLITKLKTLSSVVAPCEYQDVPAPVKLPRNARCDIAMIDYGVQRLKIALDPLDNVGKATPKEQLARLGAALDPLVKTLNNLLERTDDPAKAGWLLRWSGDKVYLVPASAWTARDGDPGKQLFGPWPIDAELGDKLKSALSRVARAETLKKLASSPADEVSRGGDDSSALAVEIIKHKSEADREGAIVQPESGALTFRNDDTVSMRITNKAKHGIDVTLLYVDKDYGIAAWFPDPDRGEINRLKPGEMLTVPKVTISAETAGKEYVVLIAVKATSKTPLEFTFLSQTSLERSRGVEAGKTPLGSLLESSLFGGATRSISRRAVEDFSIRLMPWQIMPGK